VSRKPNTLNENMLEGLRHVVAAKLLIIEDDEWYAPTYAQEMVDRLDKVDMTGERRARYYHVGSRRYGYGSKTRHASLARTGITAPLYECLHASCVAAMRDGVPFIDQFLWGHCGDVRFPNHTNDLFEEPKLSVGIKGMPGRPGLGANHRPDALPQQDDERCSMLRRWIGDEDADRYMRAVARVDV